MWIEEIYFYADQLTYPRKWEIFGWAVKDLEANIPLLQRKYCSEIHVGKVFEMIQIQQEETSNDTDSKDKLQVRIDMMRTSKLGFLAELRIQD